MPSGRAFGPGRVPPRLDSGWASGGQVLSGPGRHCRARLGVLPASIPRSSPSRSPGALTPSRTQQAWASESRVSPSLAPGAWQGRMRPRAVARRIQAAARGRPRRLLMLCRGGHPGRAGRRGRGVVARRRPGIYGGPSSGAAPSNAVMTHEAGLAQALKFGRLSDDPSRRLALRSIAALQTAGAGSGAHSYREDAAGTFECGGLLRARWGTSRRAVGTEDPGDGKERSTHLARNRGLAGIRAPARWRNGATEWGEGALPSGAKAMQAGWFPLVVELDQAGPQII